MRRFLVVAAALMLAAVVVAAGAAAARPEPTASASSTVDFRFIGSTIRSFDNNQSAPGAVSEVPDPAGSGKRVLKMTVGEGDVYPVTPTGNPRASLNSPTRIDPGDSFWWRMSFYLPHDFPRFVPGWLVLAEGPYGEPFDGTPPWHIEVNHNHIQWSRNGTYDFDVPWRMPLIRGKWINVLMHCRFGDNGFVDMWVNGHRVTFFRRGGWNPDHHGKTRRLWMTTRDGSNDQGTNFVALMNYRQAGMFNSVTVYQGQTALGPTARSVRR